MRYPSCPNCGSYPPLSCDDESETPYRCAGCGEKCFIITYARPNIEMVQEDQFAVIAGGKIMFKCDEDSFFRGLKSMKTNGLGGEKIERWVMRDEMVIRKITSLAMGTWWEVEQIGAMA